MGYKDKTWCNFRDCANFDKCDRAFTDEERSNAIQWWGSEDYLITMFNSKPECFTK